MLIIICIRIIMIKIRVIAIIVAVYTVIRIIFRINIIYGIGIIILSLRRVKERSTIFVLRRRLIATLEIPIYI